MFTADIKEQSNNLIKLTGIDYEVLCALVNYLYTSRVSITETNVQSLLEAADFLQFNSVKNDFLIRFLDVDDCLGMHYFATLHICPELKWEARRDLLCFIHLELDEMHFKTALDVQRRCLLANEGKVRPTAKRLQQAGKKLSSSMYVIGGYSVKSTYGIH
ncbi:unnamed protein product [Coregonus sp. 'balchen']|nr:unnamed protein product [Coregonus sp. 'balchen']